MCYHCALNSPTVICGVSNLITVRPCCENTVQYRNQIVASYLLLYVWDKLLYVWDMFPYVLDVQAHLKFRMKHTSQLYRKITPNESTQVFTSPPKFRQMPLR